MRINQQTFIKQLIATVATTSSLVTLYSFFIKTSPSPIGESLLFLVILLFSNFFIALFLSTEKNSINLKINNTTKLSVYFGDIGECENIVVPVNDFFDTLVNDEVVSKNSLHGKFIKNVFGGNEKELQSLIDNALEDQPYETVTNRKINRNKRYELGTVAKINHNGKDYYLVALTKFNLSNKAYIDSSAYQIVIAKLLSFIGSHSQGKKVSLPLLGGSARSGITTLTKQQKLELLILSMSLSDTLSVDNGLELVLSEHDKEELSLNSLEQKNIF
ncbi:TPA: macro domain-containing protein [Vibrio parahaemolyticus]|nr:hypothetical protein [Vibrio parahaemolyticus]